MCVCEYTHMDTHSRSCQILNDFSHIFGVASFRFSTPPKHYHKQGENFLFNWSAQEEFFISEIFDQLWKKARIYCQSHLIFFLSALTRVSPECDGWHPRCACVSSSVCVCACVRVCVCACVCERARAQDNFSFIFLIIFQLFRRLGKMMVMDETNGIYTFLHIFSTKPKPRTKNALTVLFFMFPY